MKYLFTVAVLLCSWRVSGQAPSSALFTTPRYPWGEFRDPLDIPITLAANFGELRPGHFHMGLDIRTQHRENLPVHAAADGYIVRVQVGPFGFGQAIYIRHPNGYTTVYGHLNRFFPALAAYVQQQQYRQQSWRVDLAIPSSLFPVIKGQQIAWSGNTGGSQGPHLHFEIRQTNDDVNLNPLLFGLTEHDYAGPVIRRLAWYDGNTSVYEQTPHLLPVQPVGPRAAGGPAGLASTAYGIASGVLVVPVTRIAFAISADDYVSGSPTGIFRAELSEDKNPLIGFQLDRISYNNTQNINAHIDYKTRAMGGPFLQQLFYLPGYPFPSIYRIPGSGGSVDPAAVRSDTMQRSGIAARSSNGFIDLSDGRDHQLTIHVLDNWGNAAWLGFTVRYRPGAAADADSAAGAETAKRFYPGMVDGLETADYAFYLGEKSLYDSVGIGATVSGFPGSGLSLPGGLSPVCTIGARWIPLLDPVLVRLHLPDKSAIEPAERAAGTDRIVMVCFNGADKDVVRPEWQGSWASARFHQFGNFQLVYDSVPPVITAIGPLEGADLSRASRIALNVRDNLGTLRGFRAELDGQWLCFTNDKGLAYIYKFDEHCRRAAHTLKVSVEDAAGNRSEKEFHFSR